MPEIKEKKNETPTEDKFSLNALEKYCNRLFDVAAHTFKATMAINNLSGDDMITKTKMREFIDKYQNTKVKGGNS